MQSGVKVFQYHKPVKSKKKKKKNWHGARITHQLKKRSRSTSGWISAPLSSCRSTGCGAAGAAVVEPRSGDQGRGRNWQREGAAGAGARRLAAVRWAEDWRRIQRRVVAHLRDRRKGDAERRRSESARGSGGAPRPPESSRGTAAEGRWAYLQASGQILGGAARETR
jgi:hypothetical protein